MTRDAEDVDSRLERVILDLLERRAPTSSICPSDAARAVDPDGWRDLMGPARAAARRLCDAGLAVTTRGDEVVDALSPGGPIRIRRPPTSQRD